MRRHSFYWTPLVVTLLFCFGGCASEPDISDYVEVGKQDLLEITRDEPHSSLATWGFDGRCGDHYCFSELFSPFSSEQDRWSALVSPRKVKIKVAEVEFNSSYIKNIDGEVFSFGSDTKRFCAHDLAKAPAPAPDEQDVEEVQHMSPIAGILEARVWIRSIGIHESSIGGTEHVSGVGNAVVTRASKSGSREPCPFRT